MCGPPRLLAGFWRVHLLLLTVKRDFASAVKSKVMEGHLECLKHLHNNDAENFLIIIMYNSDGINIILGKSSA